MIWSACKNKNLFALFFSLGNNLAALVDNLFSVIFLFLICKLSRISYLVKSEVGEVERKSFIGFLRKIVRAVNTEIFLYEVNLAYILHIVFDNLGVVSNNRTVVMVISEMLVKIIGKTGVENCFCAHINKSLNVTVNKLCREANGIARNCLLTSLIKLSC